MDGSTAIVLAFLFAFFVATVTLASIGLHDECDSVAGLTSQCKLFMAIISGLTLPFALLVTFSGVYKYRAIFPESDRPTWKIAIKFFSTSLFLGGFVQMLLWAFAIQDSRAPLTRTDYASFAGLGFGAFFCLTTCLYCGATLVWDLLVDAKEEQVGGVPRYFAKGLAKVTVVTNRIENNWVLSGFHVAINPQSAKLFLFFICTLLFVCTGFFFTQTFLETRISPSCLDDYHCFTDLTSLDGIDGNIAVNCATAPRLECTSRYYKCNYVCFRFMTQTDVFNGAAKSYALYMFLLHGVTANVFRGLALSQRITNRSRFGIGILGIAVVVVYVWLFLLPIYHGSFAESDLFRCVGITGALISSLALARHTTFRRKSKTGGKEPGDTEMVPAEAWNAQNDEPKED